MELYEVESRIEALEARVKGLEDRLEHKPGRLEDSEINYLHKKEKPRRE